MYKRQYDDGRLEYEVKFWVDTTEYEYTVDGATGDIRKSEREPHPSASSADIGPVSYTHLDVYKRQPISTMLAICCTSSQLTSIRALLPISRHGAASTRDFIFPSLAVCIVFVNPFPCLLYTSGHHLLHHGPQREQP